MNNHFLPFALPDIGEEEIEYVTQTLRSGWITTGPVTRKFEEEFQAYIGKEVEAIAVNSATSGLHLALEACGIVPGDEVIVPTLTFTATAEVVRYLGADPVFIDCDPDTLNIDISKIEEKITTRTKAIIPVHFAGLPCDMEAILAIANKYKLKVIEDAAHALPSKINNTLIGQHNSDVVVYSFYATKTMTTGEGGMLVTKNPELARRCKIMRLHGINRDAFDRYTSTTPSWQYEVVAPGFKYNLTDIASSIGLCQLKKLEAFQKKREDMAKTYFSGLKDLPIKLPPQVLNPNTDMHSWHLFVISLTKKAKISRNEFINLMSEQKIGTSVHFIPLHLLKVWREKYKLKAEDFPVSTNYYMNSVSLPLYTKMTEEDQNRVIKAIYNILT